MGHTIPYNTLSAQVCRQHTGGMGAVEHPYLPIPIGLYVIGKYHRQADLVQRQLFTDVLFAFNDPQGKGFTDINEQILITQFFKELPCLIPGMACYNPVNQGGAEHAGLLHPLGKGLGKLPYANQGKYTFLQLFTVMLNQLHRQHNQALVRIPGKFLITGIEELCQLAGICLRQTFKMIIFIQCDAGLCGIGNHKPQAIQLCQCQKAIQILCAVHHLLHAGYLTGFLHSFAIFLSPQNNGVIVILLAEILQTAKADGLNNGNISVKCALFIGNVEHIVHKGSQKIALTELGYPNRSFLL